MSGTAVRHQFMREFRRLMPHARTMAAMTVAFYVMQTLGAMAVGYWLLQAEISVLTVTGLALVILFIGTRFRGFNNIVHECTHFTFCEHREDNVLWGSICASLTLGCFRDYREEHLTHHAHLGDYERDRDFQRIRDLRIEEPLTPRVIARHFVTAATGRHLPYYLGVNLTARDGKIYAAMKAGLVGLAVLLLLLDPVAAVLLVWLPFVWVFTAINYFTDCVDHGGLIDAEDELDSSRNVPLPRQLRFLLFPRNDCFHLVHHLFPQVPARHLAACHERLLSNPDYRARMRLPVPGRAATPDPEPKGAESSWGPEGVSTHP